MIKEIETPKIDFNFSIFNDDKFFYNEENNEYFLEDKNKSKFYFNLKGNLHRIGKFAIDFYDKRKYWIKKWKIS